ncbi:hypothetical protein GUJ93_ZPchr0010g10328 [Zizania palustris]|uniref:Uncharacterized protein n=1 Tax=Zizania palustris TaxID=103762 RepID=A0A8J5TDR7_ZIZPA|nr:hypothetical protein GUJ93_ZPchr0010g10328 [Zizania palustris]
MCKTRKRQALTFSRTEAVFDVVSRQGDHRIPPREPLKLKSPLHAWDSHIEQLSLCLSRRESPERGATPLYLPRPHRMPPPVRACALTVTHTPSPNLLPADVYVLTHVVTMLSDFPDSGLQLNLIP